MKKLYIGTSGWLYQDWEGIFYPTGLSSKDKLKYFAQHFNTAEINYSFYHLPRPSTYQNWYQATPVDFIFAVKVSRFITHIKRLKGIKEAWQQFFQNALFLKEKLGPFLLQFPPSFQATAENIKRLKEFLTTATKPKKQTKAMAINWRLAMEFRHSSWCQSEIYNLLKKYNTAWVIADSPTWPKAEVVTADFVYLRFHGQPILFASPYGRAQLRVWAEKIKKWQKKNLDIYVYFNNDVAGYAIADAKTLLDLINK